MVDKKAAIATREGSTSGRVVFKDNRTRYHFCEEVGFLYDYRDYLYLPGLFMGGEDGYLTPVFFRSHVLHKYRNTQGYRVDLASNSYGTIYFPDGDYLPFGVNRRGEIITWLGDLDLLPTDEQHYLRSENIESTHDIASEFYDSQINVVFSASSKERQMFSMRAKFIRDANALIEFNTSQLDEEATTLIEHFSPPLDEGRKTIVDAFHDLHKVCIETISREAFSQDLSRRGIKVDPSLGSLKVLQLWTEKILKCVDAPDVLFSLFILNDLRKLEAHLIGSNTANEILSSATERLSLSPGSNMSDIYQELIIKLHRMYERLVLEISRLI